MSDKTEWQWRYIAEEHSRTEEESIKDLSDYFRKQFTFYFKAKYNPAPILSDRWLSRTIYVCLFLKLTIATYSIVQLCWWVIQSIFENEIE